MARRDRQPRRYLEAVGRAGARSRIMAAERIAPYPARPLPQQIWRRLAAD
jgi:hypothetical protein